MLMQSVSFINPVQFPCKMRVYILLGFVAACSAHHLFTRSSQHGSYQGMMNATDIIRSNGYPVQTHTVQTSDGYILDLIRIPIGIRGFQGSQFQGQQPKLYLCTDPEKPPSAPCFLRFDQEPARQGAQFQHQSGQSQSQQQQWQKLPGYLSQNQQHQTGQSQSQQQQWQPRVQGYLSQYQQGQSQEDQSSSSESAEVQNRKNVKNPQSSESDSSSSSGSSEEKGIMKRPVVLLMPSLLSSADDFVLGGPSEGLAFILADNGYDVFLGNARGSVYGRQHTVLNPDRDPAFWRFCWDDIGMKDLPAIIDKMLKITREDRIYYIGHMQGSTVFYVMASERPEYNNKIRAMVSLGPVAFMGHSTNPMLKLVSQKLDNQGWLIKNLGASEFKPSHELLAQGGQGECSRMGNNQEICRNEFFLLNGFNSKNLNSTTVASMLERVPAGASARQIIHNAQLVKSGRFQKWSSDAHSSNAEDYNLDKVTSPVIILYTPEDSVSSVTDVEMLKRKLPNVKQAVSLNTLTNNLDLLHAKDVADVVYNRMMKMMNNIGYNA